MNRMQQGIASIPRQTVIRDQPHMLAYITPAEAMLLKQNGGSGLPSHGGVPEFGFWSSTFGGGNSFDQSMQNTFGGNDGGSFVDGEWQGDTGDNRPESGIGSYIDANQGNSGGGATAPTRRVNNAGNGYEVGDRVPIQGPTSFFDSNLNKPPEGWAAYHGGSAGNSSDNDDIARAAMMGSGINTGTAPVDDVTTVEPIRSGLPTFVTGEEDRVEQGTISDILKPKVSNQPDYGFKFPEGPPGYYPAVMVDWRNPVTGETASFTAGMEPPAGSPWEKGRYTPEEQNQIYKDINLTPAEIEETIVTPVAPFQPIVTPVAAPIPPTIPNLPSLELPQMVPPAQEGIASLAPLPTVPASQPFIPTQAPINTGYNFQELLNMYKNPYA